MSSGQVGSQGIVFDPMSDEFFEDPFPLYKRMRDQAPVYHNNQYGFWALSRYQDVMDATTNWRTFSSAHGQTLADLLDPNFNGTRISMGRK